MIEISNEALGACQPTGGDGRVAEVGRVPIHDADRGPTGTGHVTEPVISDVCTPVVGQAGALYVESPSSILSSSSSSSRV